MEQNSISLTVFFEDPFWVGVFERVSDNKLSVCKVTFGAKPKDYEVYSLILGKYYSFIFSSSVETADKKLSTTPKKLRKKAKNLLTQKGVGTKSQQALKTQREQMKAERKQISKKQRDAEKQRLFELKQQKRRKKHKGR